LSELEDPTPTMVLCRGRVVARDGRLRVPAPSAEFPWDELYTGGEPPVPLWAPSDFLLPADAPDPFPAGRLENAVITREEPVALTPRGGGRWPAEAGALVLALTDRSGEWVTRGVVLGFAPGLRALATTYTTNAGVLALGADPDAMAGAVERLREIGGGMVVAPAQGHAAEFPLPLAGIQRAGGFDEAAAMAREFQQVLAACGYGHADPNYTLLFLSCDFLPDLRATQAGWVRIKTGEVLLPSERP